jgi:hypothetical protein
MKLPAAYREDPGSWQAVIETAETLLAAASEELRRAEGAAEGSARSIRRLTGVRGTGALGTLEAILPELGRRVPVPPRVWAGRAAASSEEGTFDLLRTEAPAAVLAWERAELPAPPGGELIAAAFLPAGVKVQAVVAAKIPWAGPPPAGARYEGEIFWSSAG